MTFHFQQGCGRSAGAETVSPIRQRQSGGPLHRPAAAKAEYDMFKSALVRSGRNPAETFMTPRRPALSRPRWSMNTTIPMRLTSSRWPVSCARNTKSSPHTDSSYSSMRRTSGGTRPNVQEQERREFLHAMELNIEAINRATEGIPAAKSGSTSAGATGRAHTLMISRSHELLPLLYRAKVGALSIEFANPRHQHEYQAIRESVTAEMILIPGVIDTTTNFVEHPEVVANRICEAVANVGDRSG